MNSRIAAQVVVNEDGSHCLLFDDNILESIARDNTAMFRLSAENMYQKIIEVCNKIDAIPTDHEFVEGVLYTKKRDEEVFRKPR